MAALGVPDENRYGLRPGVVAGSSRIAPLTAYRDLDTRGWLNGVSNFSFHKHLPHYAVTAEDTSVVKVLATGVEPGIYLREARWLAQFRPAIVASDAPALEVLPAPAPWTGLQLFPVHQELLTHHGIRIGEAFNSEELAADEVYEFVFFYTPQRGKGRQHRTLHQPRSRSRKVAGETTTTELVPTRENAAHQIY